MKKRQIRTKHLRKPSESGGDAPFPFARKRTARDVGKDAPFPRLRSKDGPFPMWIRIHGGGPLNKDGPFPMLEAGLEWERVPFETVYQGSRSSGPSETETAVVRSSSDLHSKVPNLSLPRIDFDSQEAIVVQLGKRPDNGYLVQIDEILYFTDRLGGKGPLTTVRYSEHRTAGRLDVETYPLHIVKLINLDGETEFDPS